jgi:hypothetical protein
MPLKLRSPRPPAIAAGIEVEVHLAATRINPGFEPGSTA